MPMNKNITLYLFSNTEAFSRKENTDKETKIPRQQIVDNILNFAKSYHVEESENIENIEFNLN